MTYITAAELQAYMSIEGSQYADQLADAVASASAEIDDYCHRSFEDAGSVSARRFAPVSPRIAHVADFSTATGLIVATDDADDGTYSTVWDAADYELYPLDNFANGQDGWPFWRVEAVGSKRFPNNRRPAVKLTAQWGWSDVPAPVRQACFILASDTFQLKDSRMGVAGSDQFGQIVRVRDNEMAAKKLRRYVRDAVLVA